MAHLVVVIGTVLSTVQMVPPVWNIYQAVLILAKYYESNKKIQIHQLLNLKKQKSIFLEKQYSIPKRNTGAQLPFNEKYYLRVRWNDMRTLGK